MYDIPPGGDRNVLASHFETCAAQQGGIYQAAPPLFLKKLNNSVLFIPQLGQSRQLSLRSTSTRASDPLGAIVSLDRRRMRAVAVCVTQCKNRLHSPQWKA